MGQVRVVSLPATNAPSSRGRTSDAVELLLVAAVRVGQDAQQRRHDRDDGLGARGLGMWLGQPYPKQRC
jgi:hypothetical protein